MASGKKREAGWDGLFIAIWENAVQNDYEEAVKKLTEYAYRKAYDEYSLVVVKPLKHDSKELRAVKKAIREQAELLCERLMPRIRQLVYIESKEWPNNRYKTIKDPEYNKTFTELKKEVVAFAVDKMLELSVGDEM